MKRSFPFAVCLLMLLAAPAFAEEVEADEQPSQPTAPPTLRISIETDPADPLLFKGYGAFINLRLGALPHWGLRVGGGVAYPPDFANSGWSFGYDPVGTIAGQYFFSEKRGGFLATLVLGVANINFTAPAGEKFSVTQVQLQAGAGYRWYPFDSLGLVVTPYLTLSTPLYRSRELTVNAQTYAWPVVFPTPELLVGYEFDL